jgi:hypothetical protein
VPFNSPLKASSTKENFAGEVDLSDTADFLENRGRISRGAEDPGQRP